MVSVSRHSIRRVCAGSEQNKYEQAPSIPVLLQLLTCRVYCAAWLWPSGQDKGRGSGKPSPSISTESFYHSLNLTSRSADKINQYFPQGCRRRQQIRAIPMAFELPRMTARYVHKNKQNTCKNTRVINTWTASAWREGGPNVASGRAGFNLDIRRDS